MAMVGSNGRLFLCSSTILRLIFRSSAPSPRLPIHKCSPAMVLMYSQEHHKDERAPSTAEEFRRVAEERQRTPHQGGTEEAVTAKPNLEADKKRHEGKQEGADHRKTGDSDTISS